MGKKTRRKPAAVAAAPPEAASTLDLSALPQGPPVEHFSFVVKVPFTLKANAPVVHTATHTDPAGTAWGVMWFPRGNGVEAEKNTSLYVECHT